MDERECQKQAVRIEALMQEVAAFPEPRVRAKTEELLHALLDMYGAGLTRIVEMTAQADLTGQVLLQTFAGDELVGSLLLLHGLHPIQLEERVRQAIERLQPTVQKQKGTLEFIRVEGGGAFIRLAGNCQGCGASMQALKQTVEKAIYDAAPELDQIHIEEVTADQRATVPVKFMPTRKRKEQASTNDETDTPATPDQSRTGVSRTR